MFLLYVVSFLTILLVYLLQGVYKRYKLTSYLISKFPTAPYHPITGGLFYFPRDPPGIFKHLLEHHKLGKTVLRLGILYDSVLIISDPNDLEAVLANPNSKGARKGYNYSYLHAWLGTGLLTSFGEKWFQRRKIITPSFHFSILEQFVEVFNQQGDIFMKKLKTKTGKGDIDIYADIALYALDVICETAMGVTLKAQSESDSEYVQAVKEMTDLLHRKVFNPLKPYPALYNLTKDGRREKEVIKILHSFTDSVIIQRRDLLLNKSAKKESENEFGQKTKKNFLDMLLHANPGGTPLTNFDIREEVDTFMFEGHDTTTSAIAFTCYYLSHHQDVQDKVYAEVAEKFDGLKDVKMTTSDIMDLTYLEMVIKETLRLNPSVPFIGRWLTEPTVLDGVTVPAGTNLTLDIYAVQHNPEIYPNPEKFDPERFSPEGVQKRHPFAYVPFSAGARNCIGRKFAVLEMKSVIAKIIYNFKIRPSKTNVTLQADLILKSANGVHVQLEERKR